MWRGIRKTLAVWTNLWGINGYCVSLEVSISSVFSTLPAQRHLTCCGTYLMFAYFLEVLKIFISDGDSECQRTEPCTPGVNYQSGSTCIVVQKAPVCWIGEISDPSNAGNLKRYVRKLLENRKIALLV